MRNTIQGPKVSWIDIQDPNEGDVEFLREKYGFHPLTLSELIPQAWRVKVERFPSYLFFIFYYPVYSKAEKRTRPRELDVIVGKDVLVTSHYSSILPLKAVFDKCNLYEDDREHQMSRTAGHLLYHIMNEMRQSTFQKLDRISKKLHEIEEEMFQGNEKAMLREISYTKADIINFWRIVSPQGEVLESLRKEVREFFDDDLDHYFSRLLGDWSLARNDLDAYMETIQGLEETNNALLTERTNEIVKILTMFSVIVFPLTLLAAIFGMNTLTLPLTGYPGDFWVLSGIMAVGTLFMIWFFKHKGWYK